LSVGKRPGYNEFGRFRDFPGENSMRLNLAVPIVLAASALAPAPTLADDPPAARVYELRTYQTHPGKLDALNARFRDHTTEIFDRHGMTSVGYWMPADEDKGAGQTLVYLLSFPGREAAEKSWAAFRADEEWQKVKAESEADGPLVAKVESVFLEPNDYSPDPATAKEHTGEPRTFELRTYVASPGKLDDLNTRFREHTMELFRKHGMTNVGYWTPADDDKGRENTLVYLLAFPSREAAKASWKAFSDDPEWQKVYRESQPDGVPLAAEVTSVYMTPTDYSSIK
jgi:hypothetical protein